MKNSTDTGRGSNVKIRRLTVDDAAVISGAFYEIGWSKPVSLYERYVREQESGDRVVFVAEVEATFAGYLSVLWKPDYRYFVDQKIPEIQDLNVLPSFRRRGIGSVLLDKAESVISERSDVAGLGVGVTPDYGAAQRIYVKRGYVPDGRGLTQNGKYLRHNEPIRVNDATVLWFTKDLT